METKTKTENRTKRANNRGAVLLTHDGRCHLVPYGGGGLDELRRLIRCDWVEAVRLRGPLAGLSMWCDEEGKLRDHVANLPASLLYRSIGGDYMAGRVLVLADDPETGNATALTDEQRRRVVFFLRVAAMGHYFNGGGEIEATGPMCRVYEI